MAPFNWSTQPVGARAPNALSMPIFYINRGGKNLPACRKNILERAKVELRRQFGRV
jgi:hypothetical protein